MIERSASVNRYPLCQSGSGSTLQFRLYGKGIQNLVLSENFVLRIGHTLFFLIYQAMSLNLKIPEYLSTKIRFMEDFYYYYIYKFINLKEDNRIEK